MKKKILPMIFLLSLGVLLCSALMAQTQFYDLYIAGEQVTSDNASNLSAINGVSGMVTYDHSAKMLTLENASIESTSNIIGIKSEIENLKINLVGENAINSASTCLKHYKATEINGSGSLTLTTTSTYIGNVALYMSKAPLTIKDCSVEVIAVGYGIVGHNGQSGENLVIDNATIKATGTNKGSIVDIESLTLNNCNIITPEGAAFDETLHGVALNGEIVKEQVVIEPNGSSESYALYIAGEQVTSENAGDLSVLDGVDGEVTYDPGTNTLTLNNATINTGAAIETFIPDLKIILMGVNTIEASVFCLKNHASTQIEGFLGGSNDTLIANSSGTIGIFMLAPLTITYCSIEVEGTKWGIAGNDGESGEDLILESAWVKATGAAVASIADIQSITFGACSIVAPVGADFDADMHAVTLNGEVVTEQVVIEAYPYDGIKDNVEMANVSAYPNPVNEILYLETEASNFNAEFYNAQGQLVLQEQNNKSISVANLTKGVYMLKLITEKGTYSCKIMKN